MGCMGIGDPSKGMNKWAVPEEESREIIRYALDQGINFFDTAMSYQEGSSEEVLGKALKDFATCGGLSGQELKTPWAGLC